MGLPARALSCPVAVWGVLSGTKIGLDREPEQSEAKTKEANVSRKWGHPLEQGPKQQTATHVILSICRSCDSIAARQSSGGTAFQSRGGRRGRGTRPEARGPTPRVTLAQQTTDDTKQTKRNAREIGPACNTNQNTIQKAETEASKCAHVFVKGCPKAARMHM